MFEKSRLELQSNARKDKKKISMIGMEGPEFQCLEG